jgi:hypothetical protein
MLLLLTEFVCVKQHVTVMQNNDMADLEQQLIKANEAAVV